MCLQKFNWSQLLFAIFRSGTTLKNSNPTHHNSMRVYVCASARVYRADFVYNEILVASPFIIMVLFGCANEFQVLEMAIAVVAVV